jgi:LexA-binding, inner membrane-associated putative hydrolase
MFLLGHMGIGWAVVRPLVVKKRSSAERLRYPWAWFLCGCILPDVIDKTLYYVLNLSPDFHVVGTRTYGHTLLFASFVLGIGWYRGSRVWNAVALGVFTHLAFDHIGDGLSLLLATRVNPLPTMARSGFDHYAGLFWPFFGQVFPEAPSENAKEHLVKSIVEKPHIPIAEVLGAFVLWREWKFRKNAARKNAAKD